MSDVMEYVVNGNRVRVKLIEFSGCRDTKAYSKDVYRALKKIGVSKEYVKVDVGGLGGGSYAQVSWSINGEDFRFHCNIFNNQYRNMGAIAQAIQDDVRHITRGVKNLWASMRQYQALPMPGGTTKNPYLEFSKGELKRLLQANHPDTMEDGFDQHKFDQIRDALKQKNEEGD